MRIKVLGLSSIAEMNPLNFPYFCWVYKNDGAKVELSLGGTITTLTNIEAGLIIVLSHHTIRLDYILDF